MIVVNVLVEGILDEAVAIRIIEASGYLPGAVYGKKGFGYIKKKIKGFNQASQGSYYLALVDFMDTHIFCPPEVVSSWLPHRSPNMLFRVVVRELESWLLADRNNLARFLNVNLAKVPDNPEHIPDPKRVIVDLARVSKSSRVRAALVPERGSTAQIGKLYTSEMVNFVKKQWNIEAASKNATSLDRCLTRLKALR